MLVEVKDLEKNYQSGEVVFKALNKVSLSVEKGEICVILGPSGSGKSTLMNILGGIDSADGGTIKVNGKYITNLKDKQLTLYRREEIGFVFQFYNLIPNLTVYENVEVARNISKDPFDVDEVLEAVGVKEMAHRFPRELSGGQQQRVSIARSLVKHPNILLCDEPTGALDYKTSKEILKLLSDMNKRFNMTMFIITHNEAIAHMANKVIKIRSGEIISNVNNQNILPVERIDW